jgi:hypothetical protein
MNEMSLPRRPAGSRCLELPSPCGPLVVVLPMSPVDGPLEATYLTESAPTRMMIASAPASPAVALAAARTLIEQAIAADPSIVRRAGDPDIAAILGLLEAKRRRRWPG